MYMYTKCRKERSVNVKQRFNLHICTMHPYVQLLIFLQYKGEIRPLLALNVKQMIFIQLFILNVKRFYIKGKSLTLNIKCNILH